jgi:hypothetical protein
LSSITISAFDLLINISGVKLPSRIPLPVREWKIEDPIGRSKEVYREVRDQIENSVMHLILELRREARPKAKTSRAAAFVRLGRHPQ